MSHRTYASGLAALLLLAACGTGEADLPAPPALLGDSFAAGEAELGGALARWSRNPADGTQLSGGAVMTVETGPHTVLWPADAEVLRPPYTVRATLLKRSGRIHEGYGVVFGGEGLEGEEDGQRYSYFLVRGDGSFLVKLRDGAATPVVRDWTRHPRIHRETGGAARANALEVRVAADSTAFLVNGVEVGRVPSAALATTGRAGLRVAHDVVVEVQAFGAEPDAAGAAP
jgi:hypothetical protein